VIFDGGFSVAITHGRVVGGAPPLAQGGPSGPRAQASFVIAMIIPITTNTTIATCVQIQNGDIQRQPTSPLEGAVPRRGQESCFRSGVCEALRYSFSPPMGQTSPTVVTGAA
jgi:hypothetical protein